MRLKTQLYRLYRKTLLTMGLRAPYLKLRLFALRKFGFIIGDKVYIHSTCQITCNYCETDISLHIGNRVSIAPCVIFCLVSHANYSRIRSLFTPRPGSIIVHDDVWIGAGAIILPGCTIGECSVIGAGAVVTKDVPPFSVVVGNPARVIRMLK